MKKWPCLGMLPGGQRRMASQKIGAQPGGNVETPTPKGPSAPHFLGSMSQLLHVRYIYLRFGDFMGQSRQICYIWSIWVNHYWLLAISHDQPSFPSFFPPILGLKHVKTARPSWWWLLLPTYQSSHTDTGTKMALITFFGGEEITI